LGLGLEQGVTQGPLVNRAAVEKVSQHVQDALNKGGKLLSGGKVPDQLSNGFFYEPTLITGGNKRMLVATDETFGPLAVLFPFRTDEEAVELANGTEFGLAGYFYTKDNSRLLRIAQALQVGMVGANTGIMSAVETPFGGVKESGYGREGSKYGLAE
jgi:succinate-semialdehyde dehydrogenase/glutarate-semialdehyde dehydrogenase